MSALLQVAEELYGCALADFTSTRDARAKACKKEDPELSTQVKALRKPSLAAWVVNLLVRRETEQVEQVVAVGEALRHAQEAMSGDDLRTLTRQRRQLTAAVTSRARALAAQEGHRVTPAVAEQVEATLTAAMLDEQCGRALRSGLLVTALAASGVEQVVVALAVPEALGFEATSRQAPPPARPDLRVVPDPEADEKACTAARDTLAAADATWEEAVAARDSSAGVVADLEARGLQLQARIDELRRSIAEVESEAEELDDELSDAEDSTAEAQDVVTGAEQDRERARAALARLSPSSKG